MNFSCAYVKNVLITFIISFGIALLSGRIIFGIIDNSFVWKALINSLVFAFLFQFFFKQKDKTSKPQNGL